MSLDVHLPRGFFVKSATDVICKVRNRSCRALRQGVTPLSSPHSADRPARAAPAAGPAAPPPPAPFGLAEDGAEFPDEAETILLVDDNRLVRSSLVMMLEDIGFQVLEAETGREALSLLGEAARIDAALIDFRLPDMDGLELAGRIRADRPDLRLVMVSGQPVGPAELATIPGPPVGMLLKPFNTMQLEDLLYGPISEH